MALFPCAALRTRRQGMSERVDDVFAALQQSGKGFRMAECGIGISRGRWRRGHRRHLFPAVSEMRQRRAGCQCRGCPPGQVGVRKRSEEHTSELQSLMRISYAVFCLKKKNKHT